MVTLNEVQRAVVRMRLVDEVPGEDIARQLRMTSVHLSVHFFRARQKLARCVAGVGTPPVAKPEPNQTSSQSRRIAPAPARSLAKAS